MPATRKRRRPILLLTAIAVLLLLVVVHLALPSLIRSQLEQALDPQPGRGTYLGEINLNLFTGLMVIDDVLLGRPGHVYLRAAHLVVDLDTLALLKGQLRVQQVVLNTGFWRVARTEDGGIDPGIPLPAAGEAESSSAVPSLWIDLARVSNFRLLYSDRQSGLPQQRILVDHIDLRGFNPAAETAAPLQALLKWDKARIRFDGDLATGNGLALSGDLALDRLDLGKTTRLARVEPPLSGLLSGSLNLQSAQDRLKLEGDISGDDLGYQMERQALAVQQLKLDALQLQLQQGQLEVRGDVRGDGLSYRAEQQAITMQQLKLGKLQVRLQQGQLAVQGNIRGDGLSYQGGQQGLAARELGIDAVEAQFPLDDPTRLELKVGAVSSKKLQLHQDQQKLALAEGNLQGHWQLSLAKRLLTQQGLRLDLRGVSLAQASQQLQFDNLTLRLHAAGIPLDDPAAQGSLALDKAEFAAPELGQDRVRMDSLRIPDWQWGKGQLRLAATDVATIAFVDYPARIAHIALGGSTLSAQRLDLGELTLRDLQAELQRKADGKWQLPVQEAPAANAVPAAASGKTPAAVKEAAGPEFRLAGVVFEGDNRLHFIDRSLKPALDQVIRIETLRLGPIDSREPNKDTPLELALKPDKYSQLKLTAQLRPFAPSFYIDAKGKLEGLNMPLVNGMVANDLGNRFLKGELDDSFDLKIDEQHLKMQNALTLDSLDVEPIAGKEGPPLSTAIALLENRDGQIKIDVPVDGDLSNPNFRVLGALNPIITKAVAGTAALAIQPFGSVLLLGSLLADQALKVTFAPVPFVPKSAEPQDGVAGKLKQLGSNLAERPKLRLRVCGIVSEADRSKNKKGEYLEPEKDLLALADRRAAAVRGLLEKAGASATQLRDCRPSIDTDPNGKPRVEIRL